MMGYLMDGGWMMLPLLVCSVVLVAVIIDRARAFRAASKSDAAKLRKVVRESVADGDVAAAVSACETEEGPVAAVLLTGKGNISISAGEAKVLREYCEREGGMLFIDNGGGHFDGSVKNLLRKVFPGKPLVDVPNDDPIYQRPYVFPDGAPPFWHHAGYRAMGIREDGRWLVYYRPGDINDAWRDDHSGASAEVADQAYKLGVNVMFYAFNQYYRRHYEQ